MRSGSIARTARPCPRLRDRAPFRMTGVQADSSSPIILAEKLTKVYCKARIPVPAVRGVSLASRAGGICLDRGAVGFRQVHAVLPLGRTDPGYGGTRSDRRCRLCHAERRRANPACASIASAFVFQKFNLLPTLTAMGNIEIAYAVSGRKEPLDQGISTTSAISWRSGAGSSIGPRN